MIRILNLQVAEFVRKELSGFYVIFWAAFLLPQFSLAKEDVFIQAEQLEQALDSDQSVSTAGELKPADLLNCSEVLSVSKTRVPVRFAPPEQRLIRHRKRLIPQTGFIVLSALAYLITPSPGLDPQIQKAVTENVYGAAPVADWISSGGISTSQGKRLLQTATSGFQNHLAPLYSRVDEFVQLGIWPEEAGSLAKDILGQISADPLALTKIDALTRAIGEDPNFLRLLNWVPVDQQYSLRLWLTPRVEFAGHSDAYWMSVLHNPEHRGLIFQQTRGLASLRKIQTFNLDFSLATLVEMTQRTIANGDEIARKMWRARQMHLPEVDTFARADIPQFSTPATYGSVRVNSELDRWNLIVFDPHFEGIKKRWLDGSIDDLTALTEATAVLQKL